MQKAIVVGFECSKTQGTPTRKYYQLGIPFLGFPAGTMRITWFSLSNANTFADPLSNNAKVSF